MRPNISYFAFIFLLTMCSKKSKPNLSIYAGYNPAYVTIVNTDTVSLIDPTVATSDFDSIVSGKFKPGDTILFRHPLKDVDFLSVHGSSRLDKLNLYYSHMFMFNRDLKLFKIKVD